MPTAGLLPTTLVQANRTTVLARWAALGASLAAVLITELAAPYDAVRPPLTVLVTGALLNAAAWFYVRSLTDSSALGRQVELSILLYGYLVTDLFLMAAAVYQSGGARSPFVWLYVLHPALVGTVLPRRAAGVMVALAVLSLAGALSATPASAAPGVGAGAAAGAERYPVEHLVFGSIFMVVAVAVAGRLRQDLERAREGWRRRALELAVLNQVVEADSSFSGDADGWIRHITQVLASTLYPEDVGFIFVEQEGRILRPHPSYHGLGPHPERLTIPMGTGITGTVARDGEPLLVPNVSRDPRFLRLVPTVAAELCVPVRAEGRIVGVLNVETRRSGVLSQEDVHLMATIADHVGTVLARERVLASERAARRKAESLEQVAAVLNSTLDREALLERVLEELNRLVPSDSTSVHLMEEDLLRVVAGRGFKEDVETLGMTFPLADDHPHRAVIQDRRPLIVPDAPRAYPIFREKPHDAVRSWLGVPLICRGRVIGMIALERHQVNAFTQEEAETAMAFANHVAIALENAGRYEMTLQQALTDELTGLYNRRYFTRELEREVIRSHRYQHSVALLMIDLDDFKRYNDLYGHPTGDRILKELAELLRTVLRPTDSLVRYGGEEFAVILPETDAAGALALAERLRCAVAGHRFIGVEESPLGPVTLSLGVAVFPEHARDARGLLQAADQALLGAKGRKNRTCLFGSEEEPDPAGPEG